MDAFLPAHALEGSQIILLVLALITAFGFEFINGFHDTANAVATVIYTKALRPTQAILLSGTCNFLGVVLSGVGVAYAIVNLLPVELIVKGNGSEGIAMVFAVLLSAVIWNLGTWYFGIPATHCGTKVRLTNLRETLNEKRRTITEGARASGQTQTRSGKYRASRGGCFYSLRLLCVPMLR